MTDRKPDHGDILSALADPTRRAVLDALREGPRAVSAIAENLPVSRPAVSQHLKVLLEAGLVTMTSQGTRNLYALAEGGAAPLSAWLGALSTVPPETSEISGLRRSVDVRLTPAETWQLFCEDLAIWWPVAVVSLSAKRAGALPQAVILTPEVGAPIREVLFDGTEDKWGRVAHVEPAVEIRLEWHFDADPSEVVVRFVSQSGGTRLILTHDVDTAETRAMWDLVITERFAAAAASSLSNF